MASFSTDNVSIFSIFIFLFPLPNISSHLFTFSPKACRTNFLKQFKQAAAKVKIVDFRNKLAEVFDISYTDIIRSLIESKVDSYGK